MVSYIFFSFWFKFLQIKKKKALPSSSKQSTAIKPKPETCSEFQYVTVNVPQGVLDGEDLQLEFLKFPVNKKFPHDSTVKIFTIAAKALSVPASERAPCVPAP